MSTQNSDSGRNVAASAERREGAGRAEQAEGRPYGRPEVHDLGSLVLVQGNDSIGYHDHDFQYFNI